MRRAVLLAGTVALLCAAQLGQAADLQAGWYVKLGGVTLYGWEIDHDTAVDWNFIGGLGTYAPFQVTSPDPWWPQRAVAVPADASDVQPGTGVELWGEPVRAISFALTDVAFHWETLYQGSQMRLQLLSYSAGSGYTMLWSQDLSGLHFDFGGVLHWGQYIPVGHQLVFRVAAVPEPGQTLALTTGLAVWLLARRRASLC